MSIEDESPEETKAREAAARQTEAATAQAEEASVRARASAQAGT